MHRLYQAAARHGQPRLLAKERRPLAERQTELLVEDNGQGDRLRPELRRSGAQRVRCLQPMPALDPATTRAAASHVDPNVTDDDLGDWQLFLILGDTSFHHGAVALGTSRRQRRVIRCIHLQRDPASRFEAVRAARLPPRSLRMARERFRERGGLPKPGTPHRIELVLQPLVLLAQPVALTLNPFKLALQAVDLATRLLEFRDRLVLRPRRGWRRRPRACYARTGKYVQDRMFGDRDHGWPCACSDPLIRYDPCSSSSCSLRAFVSSWSR